MGFWNSLASAAGEKTGKAVTNAIFGKYADDQRIGIRGMETSNNQSRNDDISTKLELQKQSIELEADLREKERNQKMLDDLLLLEFDGEQLAPNIKILTKLSSMIDIWIKDKNMTTIYDVAMSKFDTGLLISQAIDESNSMVQIMAKKKEEWSAYLAEQEEIERQRLANVELERVQKEQEIQNTKTKLKKAGLMVLKIYLGIVALCIIIVIIASIFA